MIIEYFKDLKFIFKIATIGFQSIVMIKISIIPLLTAVATYFAAYYKVVKIPDWTWIPVTIFISVLVLLFIMARKMRVAQTPQLDISLTQESIITPEMQAGNLDSIRPHRLFLKIKNTSDCKINDLKVKLITLRLSDKSFQEPNMPLFFLNHGKDTNVSINSKDEERAFIGDYICNNGYSRYSIEKFIHNINDELIFIVRISSSSFNAFTKTFMLKKGIKNGFGLREVMSK